METTLKYIGVILSNCNETDMESHTWPFYELQKGPRAGSMLARGRVRLGQHQLWRIQKKYG